MSAGCNFLQMRIVETLNNEITANWNIDCLGCSTWIQEGSTVFAVDRVGNLTAASTGSCKEKNFISKSSTKPNLNLSST